MNDDSKKGPKRGDAQQASYHQFARDKRTRTVKAERVERISRREAEGEEEDQPRQPRTSYNPNFTRDNRPYERRDHAGKPHYPGREEHASDHKGGYGKPSYPGRNEEPGRRGYGGQGERPDYDAHRRQPREGGYDPARRSYGQGERRDYDAHRQPREGGYDPARRGYGGQGADRQTERRSAPYDKPQRPYPQRDEERSARRPRDYEGQGQRNYPARDNGRDQAGQGSFPHRSREEGEARGYGRSEQSRGYGRQGGYAPRGEGKGYAPRRSFDPAEAGRFGGKSSERRPAGGKKAGRERPGVFSPGDRPASYPRFAPPRQEGEVRLNRFIAQSGLCSRREADEYIAAGVVSVNGKVVTEMGTKVLPSDEVRFHDQRIHGEKKVYILMNKPKGFVTTVEDEHADKTVMDLVKGACTERVYPVGRLDKNSVGVLLISNDGDLTKQLTHPAYQKRKIYQVSLDKPLTKADMEQIAAGITLEDGEIHADQISYVKENKKEVGIEIHSGRNRIVRRIFEHLGYTVTKLDRVYFAGLTKKNLKRGQWRFLTPQEVAILKAGMYE